MAAAAKAAISGSWKCDAMLLRSQLAADGTAGGMQQATLMAAMFLLYEATISTDTIRLRRGMDDVTEGSYKVVAKTEKGITVRTVDKQGKSRGERLTFRLLGDGLLGLVVPTTTGGEIVVPMRRAGR
jgi:hypothetical protein